MIQHIDVPVTEECIWLTENVVYSQRVLPGRGWHGKTLPMHLSLVRPYDSGKKVPCIVFLSGGGWRHQEHNAYLAELSWLAKKGYAVAGVEYSCQTFRFPTQIEEIKTAIRFLRAHAEEFHIDEARIGVMGGSAGAHLAAMIGVTGQAREYDKGEWAEQSSAVNAVCTWYLPSNLFHDRDPEAAYTQTMFLGYPIAERPEEGKKACPALLVDENTPPFLMLHGTQDKRVPHEQSEEMYEALEAHNIPAELYLINGAGHGAPEFLQPPVRKIILEFFDRWLKNQG